MNNYIAKILIVFGILAIILGVLFYFNIKIPLGKLPGDIVVKNKNSAFYFPITTSIIISIILSFIMWIISKF